MVKIRVSRYGGSFANMESKVVDTADIPKEWYSFLIKTGFRRITVYLNYTNNNDYRPRAAYGGRVYRVDGCKRSMTYDANFELGELDEDRFIYLKQFVNYILDYY
jgi:hypothetical protein